MSTRCPRCDASPGPTAQAPCAGCGTAALVSPPGSPASTPAPRGSLPGGKPPAEAAGLSWPRRYFATLLAVTLRPRVFFAQLSREEVRGISWFAWVSVLLGSAGSYGWSVWMTASLWRLLQADATTAMGDALDQRVASWLADTPEVRGELLRQLPQLHAQALSAFLLAPLIAWFTLHVVAGLLHVTCGNLRRPHQERVPFEHTYRFAVYALGPLFFVALPSVGALAEAWTLVVLSVAMARLHRLSRLGVVAGVWLPLLMVSWLWTQDLLPRLAMPFAQRVGLALAAGPESAVPPASLPNPPGGFDENLLDLPPLPAPDRDHEVELSPRAGGLESERTFRSSRGPLHLRHWAADRAGGVVEVEVTVENRAAESLRVEVEHATPERGEALGETHATFPCLAPGASGVLRLGYRGRAGPEPGAGELNAGELNAGEFRGGEFTARALLQTGPTLAVDACSADAPPDAP